MVDAIIINNNKKGVSDVAPDKNNRNPIVENNDEPDFEQARTKHWR